MSLRQLSNFPATQRFMMSLNCGDRQYKDAIGNTCIRRVEVDCTNSISLVLAVGDHSTRGVVLWIKRDASSSNIHTLYF